MMIMPIHGVSMQPITTPPACIFLSPHGISKLLTYKPITPLLHFGRRSSYKSHSGTYGWSISLCHFIGSSKEQKEWQERRRRLFLHFYWSEFVCYMSHQGSTAALRFSDLSAGGHIADSVVGNICLATYSERIWKGNKNNSWRMMRSDPNLNSLTTKIWMAQLALLCESCLQKFLHSFLLLNCLFFLFFGTLYLNEAPARAEETISTSLPLDFRNVELFESRVKGLTHDFQSTSTFIKNTTVMGVGTWRDMNEPNFAHSSVSSAVMIYTVSDNAVICRETYGIFPCSTSLSGNMFLILVYGYLLFTAAKLISEGSELLLEVMNPGLIGGLLLPIVGALPDAALIFASGANSSVEEAQQEVLVGVGVLAGSTSMVLTVAWAGSLVAGRCDLSGPQKTAKELTLTRGFDLFHTGITIDEQTRWGALVMMISAAPYVCAQLPLLDGHPGEGPASALAGCILAFVGVIIYCVYQIISPWLQNKKIEEARLQLLRSAALQGITSLSPSSMITSALLFQEDKGGPFPGLLQEIFTSFDRNKDGKIGEDELRGLILGLNIEKGCIPPKEQVKTWLNEFDIDADGLLTEAEFDLGLRKWARQVVKEKQTLRFQRLKNSVAGNDPNFWGAKLDDARKTLQLLESEIDSGADDSVNEDFKSSVIDSSKIYKKASFLLVFGASLAAVFSDPLIDSIQGFSTASEIPPFFVAFIVVPFASNASELISSILFATKRRKRNISLTFAQIYGSVTMNNTLCLGIFLGLVYARGLTWDFSSEVTVVLLNILCIGLIGVSRTTFPLWYAIPVFSLYFASLGGVALLDIFLGWH